MAPADPHPATDPARSVTEQRLRLLVTARPHQAAPGRLDLVRDPLLRVLWSNQP